jgi:hypothetical protein
MSPVEWYYARGNKQMGPVSSTELKRLSSAGELRREDLVWREGMAEWTLARNVRGLFEDENKAAAAVAEAMAAHAAGIPSTIGQAAATAPTTSVASRARRTPGRHLFETLLDWLRAEFDAAFLEKTEKFFRACGWYGLLAAMFLVAVYATIMAVKTHSLAVIPWDLAVLLVLAVLQYAAGKFCDVLEQLNRTTSSTLSSTAYPDFCALLSLAIGLAFLIGSPLMAVSLAMHLAVGAAPTVVAGVVGFLFGLVLFLVFCYSAIVAVNLGALNISIVPEVRAGEEAIGVSAFVLKALLRLVPVSFGASVIAGVLAMGYACYLAATATEDLGRLLFPTIAGYAQWTVIGFAALPVAAYLAFVFYCLMIEVCRAFLILPGKIDKLAAKDEEKKGGQ